MRNGPLRRSSIAICLFLFIGACPLPGQKAHTPGQELRDIPISLGDMAFNEARNRGYDSQQIVTWEAKNILVTTSGTFAAEFKTRYEGPPVSYPVVLDVLFVRIQAEYLSLPFGDSYYPPLGEMVALVAKHSAPRSARFIASEMFTVPDVSDRGNLLRTVWLNLTWVRVYDAGEQLGFHVFAGDERRYYPDIPQISFDQLTQSIIGRLGYYQVLLGRGRGSGVFSYQKWIRQYLKNR
jgi:hypothetical protein